MDQKQYILGLRDAYENLSTATRRDRDRATAAELAQLLGWAAQESEWWRCRLGAWSATAEDPALTLASLPVTTRQDLQRSYDAMALTLPGSHDDDYGIRYTSGSTAQPRAVRKHKPTAIADYHAIALLAAAWHRLDLTRPIGMFRPSATPTAGLVPLGAPWSYVAEGPRAFYRQLFGTSPQDQLAAIREFGPATVFGGPLLLRQLAALQIAEPSREPVRFDQAWLVGAPVDDETRALAGDAFGCRVVDLYSCGEVGYLAIQCPHADHLHVMEPSVVIEVVDEGGQPCAVGETGRVLVTALHSFAMPLIRYDLGDRAVLGEPCAAGITLPVLERVVGRVEVALTLPDGSVRPVYLGVPALAGMRRIVDYRAVVFDDAVALVLNVTSPLDADEADTARVSVARSLGLDLPVRIVYADDPAWQGSWKARELEVVPDSLPPTATFADVAARLAAPITGV